MAVRLIEGFDWLASGVNVDVVMNQAGWYDGDVSQLIGNTRSDITPFAYGNCLQMQGDFANPRHLVYPVGDQTAGYFGARIYPFSTHSGYGALTFNDLINNVCQFSVAWGQFGILRAFRGLPVNGAVGGTVLQASAPGAFVNNAWFLLEVYALTDTGTAGAYEVRINTVPVFTVPNANTRAGGRSLFDAVGIWGSDAAGFAGFCEYLIDDVWFCDPTGAINNSFLGNVRVKTLVANGDGASTDFTIGGSAPAATRWQSLKNNGLTTAQLLYSATAGDKELVTVAPIINSPLVHAIQLGGSWWQDDATQRAARNILKTAGGAFVNGADNYLNQSPTVYRDIIETNPDTSAKFTGTEANAVQIGGEVRV